MAFEKKQGLSELDRLCAELDEEDKKKQEKALKKRCKKKNAKRKSKDLSPLLTTEENDKNIINNDEVLNILSYDKSLEYEEEEEDNEGGIPLEEVRLFRAGFPDVIQQREKIRNDLRRRFAEMCQGKLSNGN